MDVGAVQADGPSGQEGLQDEEDLAQDVFVRAWEKMPLFRGESAFSTWLHRLAVNVVLMRLRKKTLAETSLEETTEPDEEAGGPR